MKNTGITRSATSSLKEYSSFGLAELRMDQNLYFTAGYKRDVQPGKEKQINKQIQSSYDAD